MTKKVSIAIKVDKEVKDILQELAMSRFQSLSSYVESLIAVDVLRHQQGEVTLEALEAMIMRVLEQHEERKKRPTRAKSPRDVELFDGLSLDAWDSWLNHCRGLGAPVKYGEGEKTVEQLKGWDKEGFNVEAIIDECIKSVSRRLYLPRGAILSVRGGR